MTPFESFETEYPVLQVVQVVVELQTLHSLRQLVQEAVVLKNPSPQVVHSVPVTQMLQPLEQLLQEGGVA